MNFNNLHISQSIIFLNHLRISTLFPHAAHKQVAVWLWSLRHSLRTPDLDFQLKRMVGNSLISLLAHRYILNTWWAVLVNSVLSLFYTCEYKTICGKKITPERLFFCIFTLYELEKTKIFLTFKAVSRL